MENALFYTFSTIAQTLAAAIALLGAFALYRIQTIGSSLHDLGVTAMQPYLPDDTARKLSAEEKYVDLLEYLRNTQPRNPREANDPYQVATRRTLGTHVKTLSSLHRLLKWALAVTVVVIVSSVIILAVTPAIAAKPGVTVAVFTVGIGSFAGCLVVYAVLVMRSLQ